MERNGALIGRAALWKRWEIGYILDPAHWGQGFATEAVGALLDEIWRRFPEADALTAETDPRNTASCRLLERHGFALTELARGNFLYGGTEWCDTARYVLKRPDAKP